MLFNFLIAILAIFAASCTSNSSKISSGVFDEKAKNNALENILIEKDNLFTHILFELLKGSASIIPEKEESIDLVKAILEGTALEQLKEIVDFDGPNISGLFVSLISRFFLFNLEEAGDIINSNIDDESIRLLSGDDIENIVDNILKNHRDNSLKIMLDLLKSFEINIKDINDFLYSLDNDLFDGSGSINFSNITNLVESAIEQVRTEK